ncbi:MAG: endonuclease/exonuclease/phosphatase family protein [Planctomycetota bacterium]
MTTNSKTTGTADEPNLSDSSFPKADFAAERDATKNRGRWGVARTLVAHAGLVGLTLCAIARFAPLDDVRAAMFLTYPPRLILGALGVCLSLSFLLRRKRLRAGFATVVAVALFSQLSWGGGVQPPPTDHLVVLAFNAHDATERVGELAELCETYQIDVLLLQEVKEDSRAAFIEGLPDYEFVWGDEKEKVEYSAYRPISSITGFRRSRLTSKPEVKTGITGYRTFAAEAALGGEPIWFVNVHTTKSFWLQGGVSETFSKTADKAARHAKERDSLEAWIEANASDQPVLVGGDFNAPAGTYNLRFPKLTSAHRAAGSGAHLTFPRSFPVWGIDHVLGSENIEFFAYQAVDAGFSDHYAQLAWFRLRQDY